MNLLQTSALPIFMALVIIALGLTGCSVPAEVIQALAKDPNAGCVSYSDMLITVVVGRSSPGGAQVDVAAGKCTITRNVAVQTTDTLGPVAPPHPLGASPMPVPGL